MAKVLLINPIIPSVSKSRIVFPTGLLWIGSFLEQNGHEVEIINAHNQDDYLDIIKRNINTSTCVGISAMTAQVPNALEISDFIRNIDPSIPIVWGGIHPTLFLGQTCTDGAVDISVKGEGEYTLLELTKYMEGSADLKSIDGISYFDKKDERVIETRDRRPINMDELHLIKWDLLHKDVLYRIKDFEVPVQTSRGCPHRCTFCINVATKNPFRFRSVERVLNDLEDVKSLGIKKIRFRDENFFVNAERVEKIADGMIERGFDFEWYASIRVNYFRSNQMNMERLEKIKKAGCRYFGFGAESGSQRVLDILKKDIKVEDTVNSAKVSKKIGIVPVYSFMIGIPGETKDDMMKTVDLIDKLIHICPSGKIVGPQVFRPYPGGELYETCLKLGWKEPTTLRSWVDMVMSDTYFASVRNLPWLEDPDLVETISYSAYWTNNLEDVLKNKSLFLKILTGLYFMDSKIRWKTRFFGLPIDMKFKNMLNRHRVDIK